MRSGTSLSQFMRVFLPTLSEPHSQETDVYHVFSRGVILSHDT